MPAQADMRKALHQACGRLRSVTCGRGVPIRPGSGNDSAPGFYKTKKSNSSHNECGQGPAPRPTIRGRLIPHAPHLVHNVQLMLVLLSEYPPRLSTDHAHLRGLSLSRTSTGRPALQHSGLPEVPRPLQSARKKWNLCLAGAYRQESEGGTTRATGEATGSSEGAGKAEDIELASAYAFP